MNNNHVSTSESRETLLGRAANEYFEAAARGEEPSIGDFATRYPLIADDIQRTFGAVAMIGDSISATDVAEPQQSLSQAQQLGDFRIVREIGRGGMGVVYEAEQLTLSRQIALKVLPFAAVLDPRQLERFENEARAAATLDHPAIVSIYSVGCERGVHFFAMQFVEGQSLAEVIAELQCGGPIDQPDANKSVSALARLTEKTVPGRRASKDTQAEKETVEQALDGTDKIKQPGLATTGRLFSSGELAHSRSLFRFAAQIGVQAAEALDHAHSRGIVHRDVKPGNLLLDVEGEVHVADFGLARIEADTGITMSGDILGTIRYMSPEQALSKRAVIDHRTDIYSLGATLYELVTLTPIFSVSDRQECLHKIAFEEPRQPRKLNSRVPADLEIIILKAIAKDPTDRYATAQELAADLHRYIEGKPIQARRIVATERLWRWSKRNPIVAVLTATVAVLATLVAVVALIGYAKTNVALAQVSVERQEAQQERQQAQQERNEAIQNLYVAQMRMAQKDWDDGQIARLQKTLLSYLPAPGEPDLRGWEWYFHLARCHSEEKALYGLEGAQVKSIVWNSDSTQLAATGWAGFRLWDVESGETVESLSHHGFNGCLFGWKLGERRLAWRVDGSKTSIVVQHSESRVTIEWDRELGSVAWSPDGNRIASSGPKNTVKIWDAKTGQELRELVGHGTEELQVAWSPDGKQLAATGDGSGTITIWDVESGEQTSTFKTNHFPLNYNRCLVWSPDSRRLAVGTNNFPGYVTVWDVASGKKIHSLVERAGVRSIAWSPDGSQIASGLVASTITIRDASTGEALRTIRHGNTVNALAWSPDGKWIAAGGGAGGPVKIWDAVQDQDEQVIADDVEFGEIRFSPNDQHLAYWAKGQRIKVRDANTGELLHDLLGPVGGLRLEWSPSGKLLASGGGEGSIFVYDLENGKVNSWQHEGIRTNLSTGYQRDVNVAWHPDGRQLTSVSRMKSPVRIWDASTGKQLSSFDPGHLVLSVAWSPDGERLAISDRYDSVEIWDRVGWRRLHVIEAGAITFGWSPNGQYLAAGAGGGVTTIIDTFTGRTMQTLTGGDGSVVIAGWSKDGRRIATCTFDGARIWNPETGKEVLSLPDAGWSAWSNDRKRIATSGDGKVRIYDTSIGYEIASTLSYRSQRAQMLFGEADSLTQNGNYQKAIQKLETALSFAPTDGKIQRQVAWRMLTLPEKRFVDFNLALELAQNATESLPDSRSAWQVLGWARYRQGDWQASIDAIERSVELQGDGGDPWQWFFLTMAHWQLGEKDEARRWYDQSVEWMDENHSTHEDVLSFRAEAAELLGIDIDAPNKKRGPTE